MRSFRPLLIILLLILPPMSVCAQNGGDVSVAQLKEEIQRLAAVERDQTTPADVRTLNRIFLKKRHLEFQALLQKNITSLRKYLETLEASLKPEEKLIVENTIKQAEMELQSFAEQREALSNNESQDNRRATTPVVNAAASVTAPTTESENANTSENGSAVSVASTPAVTTAAVLSSPPAVQPQGGTSLNAELNARIKSKLATLSRSRVDQTDNTKQTDVPSVSGSLGSLVDQSSASDLFGLAANFAGLSASTNDDQPEPSSVSVTASAYSLLAAIKRVDPLNPVFYDQNRKWRNFSLTLGYDDEDQPDGTKQRAKIFGAKFMFLNRRDPGLLRNKPHIDRISSNLENATAVFGNLADRTLFHVVALETVRRNIINSDFKTFAERERPRAASAVDTARADLEAATTRKAPSREIEDKTDTLEKRKETLERIDRIIANPGSADWFVLGNDSMPAKWSREERAYYVEFANEYLGPNYKQKLGDEVVAALDEFIDGQLTEAQLAAFRNLDDSAREAVESIRRAPQFSLAFTTKQRRIGIDDYLGTLIFDYGVADRINLTLNGSYAYSDSDVVGADLRGFKFAGQLRFQLNRENLLGKKPLFFDISTQGNWMNDTDAIYKAQGKLTIPIADGIEFPVSVTYANRSDLIDEREVRGQFGFTLDTARLIRAFLFR